MCIKKVELKGKDMAFCECCGKVLTDYIFFVGSPESDLPGDTNEDLGISGYHIKPHFYCDTCIQRKF